MTASGPAVTLQVKDDDKVMEPYRVHGHQRRCRRVIAHAKLAGDGQQRHRTTGNRREGRQ